MSSDNMSSGFLTLIRLLLCSDLLVFHFYLFLRVSLGPQSQFYNPGNNNTIIMLTESLEAKPEKGREEEKEQT